MAKKVKKAVKNKDAGEKSSLQISSTDVHRAWFEGYGRNGSPENKELFCKVLSKYLRQEVSKHECSKKYNILILFDNSIIIKSDSDQIYRAIKEFGDSQKPLLLVLFSRGGEPGSAYLIGKLCQEFCNSKFLVVVPRHAKSAATLLACAAHEIHMGSLSELGPIDPQIDGMPALGLKHSIEHIAELANKFPAAGDMFAKYLKLSIDLIQVGYYERVAQSAVQYAEKLLTQNTAQLPNAPADIADKLVYGYKDHGFVIDKAEATQIFGSHIIHSDTPEYGLGNTIYTILSKVNERANALNYNFYFIGHLDSTPTCIKRK